MVRSLRSSFRRGRKFADVRIWKEFHGNFEQMKWIKIKPFLIFCRRMRGLEGLLFTFQKKREENLLKSCIKWAFKKRVGDSVIPLIFYKTSQNYSLSSFKMFSLEEYNINSLSWVSYLILTIFISREKRLF